MLTLQIIFINLYVKKKYYRQRSALGSGVITQFIPVLVLLNIYENTTAAVELLAQLALFNELRIFVPIFNRKCLRTQEISGINN